MQGERLVSVHVRFRWVLSQGSDVLHVTDGFRERSYPRRKGHFSQGIYSLRIKRARLGSHVRTVGETVLWHETGTITCILYVVCFFNVFSKCGRFLHYRTTEHSKWIGNTIRCYGEQTTFRSRCKESKEVDAAHTALASVYIPSGVFTITFKICFLVCKFYQLSWPWPIVFTEAICFQTIYLHQYCWFFLQD